jgi:hypothetical protein
MYGGKKRRLDENIGFGGFRNRGLVGAGYLSLFYFSRAYLSLFLFDKKKILFELVCGLNILPLILSIEYDKVRTL